MNEIRLISVVVAMTAIALSVAIAIVVYNLVENKFSKFLKSKLIKENWNETIWNKEKVKEKQSIV